MNEITLNFVQNTITLHFSLFQLQILSYRRNSQGAVVNGGLNVGDYTLTPGGGGICNGGGTVSRSGEYLLEAVVGMCFTKFLSQISNSL